MFQRGLFGSNKSNKKKLIIKEGKILGKVKTPKKDKGVSRIFVLFMFIGVFILNKVHLITSITKLETDLLGEQTN